MHPLLQTERLILRSWRPADAAPFADLNADPDVMAHFPAPLTRAQSDALIERVERHYATHGFGPFAVELKREPGSFLGFTGLFVPQFEAPFMPAVEIGWRFAARYWGQGLAFEAATAAVTYGFEMVGLSEIVAFTVAANQRSLRLMDKLGMRTDPADNFLHPQLPAGHSLQPHVLYRLQRGDAWRA